MSVSHPSGEEVGGKTAHWQRRRRCNVLRGLRIAGMAGGVRRRNGGAMHG